MFLLFRAKKQKKSKSETASKTVLRPWIDSIDYGSEMIQMCGHFDKKVALIISLCLNEVFLFSLQKEFVVANSKLLYLRILYINRKPNKVTHVGYHRKKITLIGV